MRLVTSDILKD